MMQETQVVLDSTVQRLLETIGDELADIKAGIDRIALALERQSTTAAD